nr:tRNA-splicing endonuclease subunit Sen15-like [Cryptomonas sp.]
MFIFEECHTTNVNVPNLIKLYLRIKGFNINLAFQVYLDLCLFRGWKHVRIVYNRLTRLYLILAFNPKKKKKKNSNFYLILFIGMDARLIPEISKKITLIVSIYNLENISKTVNLAFVDQDSTIAYYSLISNFHKTAGPFV